MWTNQCHSKSCPNNDRKAAYHCGHCRYVIYCSRKCQSSHWNIHAKTCHEHAWASLDANYKVETRTNGPRKPRTEEEEEAVTQRNKGNKFQTLKSVIDNIINNTIESNAFATDFFASVRVNLQALLDTTRKLNTDNNLSLDRALSLWKENRSEKSDQEEMETKKGESLLERWRKITTEPGYDRTKTDQQIFLFIERGKLYRDLIGNCHKQLGIPRSVIMSKKSQSIANLISEDNDDTDESPLTWKDGLDKSIYLNLNWDDNKNEVLEWNIKEGGIGFDNLAEGKSDTTLFNTITYQRVEWLKGLSRVLQEFNDMVGLGEIKDSIADFILKQILYPSSPILSGQYLNFVISGNPGSGKTEIAKKFPLLLYLLGLTPVEPDELPRITTRSDWVAEYEGQTAAKTRQLLLQSIGKLLILDEAYALKANKRDVYGAEAIDQLVNDMSQYRGLISVMMLGYQDKIEQNILKSNDGLNRRFNYKWHITNYTGSELFNILCNKLIDMDYVMPGIKIKQEKKISYEIFRDLTLHFSTKTTSTPTKKGSVNITNFTPGENELDSYESIYNIIVRLQFTGIFSDINAAVIPILISDYNSTIVASLITGDSPGNSDVENFKKKYNKLKDDKVKNLSLSKFIDTLIRYALKKDIIVVKI